MCLFKAHGCLYRYTTANINLLCTEASQSVHYHIQLYSYRKQLYISFTLHIMLWPSQLATQHYTKISFIFEDKIYVSLVVQWAVSLLLVVYLYSSAIKFYKLTVFPMNGV